MFTALATSSSPCAQCPAYGILPKNSEESPNTGLGIIFVPNSVVVIIIINCHDYYYY